MKKMMNTKVVGGLWDMFWHHDWCLRDNLDPLTVYKDAESSYGHFPLSE